MSTFDGLVSLGDLHWGSILLGTAAAMVLGFLWYGPLFGKLWASKSGAGAQSGEPAKLALTAVYFLVFNAALQYLGLVFDGADDLEHAVVTGIIVGILAIGPALLSAVVWAKRSPVVFLIDVGHWVAVTFACVMVQGLIY
jgi:hypothetical protein